MKGDWKDPHADSVTLTVRLVTAERDHLDQTAKKLKMKRNEVIRRAIRSMCGMPEAPPDRRTTAFKMKQYKFGSKKNE